MQIIFRINKINFCNELLIEVILKNKNRIMGKARVKNAEDILDGLDKILKKSKINIADIKNIRTVNNLGKTRCSSLRIAKTIEKALKFGLKLN